MGQVDFSDPRTPLVDPAAAASLICHHRSRQTPRYCSTRRPVHPRITFLSRATPQLIQRRIEGQQMKAAQAAKSPRVLVIDVGGTNVKMLATGQKEPRKFPSGPTMTPRKMVHLVKRSVRDWKFDCVLATRRLGGPAQAPIPELSKSFRVACQSGAMYRNIQALQLFKSGALTRTEQRPRILSH